MAGERYADKAVKTLAAFIRANLPAAIDAVETEQGLTSGSMLDPAEVIEHRAPLDNRSPLVSVYDDSMVAIDERQRLYSVTCEIAFWVTGDADLGAGEAMRRRYVTAMLKCLQSASANGYTLGAGVILQLPREFGMGVVLGSDAPARHAFLLTTEVHVHDT